MIEMFGHRATIAEQLTAIQASLNRIESNQKLEITKMAALDDEITKLTGQVAADTTAIGSATTLINGFAAQLATAIAAATAAGATPAQLASLTALGATIDANTSALAAAVAANTTAPPLAPATSKP